MHICTKKSFRAGIDTAPLVCRVCQHKTLFTSWTGMQCDTCGADSEYEYLPDYMRTIRENTGLTRRQISDKLGYKYSTVKKYEWCRTSSIYWKKFKIFIEDFYR